MYPCTIKALSVMHQWADVQAEGNEGSGVRSAVLAHHLLQERLNTFGVLGCLLCITGSLVIVLHAPEERPLFSVSQIWMLAMRPGMHFSPCARACPPPPPPLSPPGWQSLLLYIGLP